MNFLGKEFKDRPIFVAEIGAKFESYEHLLETVLAAKEAGADFAKIQYYTAEDLVQDNGFEWEGKNLLQVYKESEFPREWLAGLFNFGEANGIPVFSSVYSLRGLVDLEYEMCPAYKISSFENENKRLLEAVDAINKPWIMSTGMLQDHPLNQVTWIVNPDILLHCVSKYPCPLREADLSRISRLKDKYPAVGYSDHTTTTLSAMYATILGACMIEKHFALKSSEFTFSPFDFKLMIECCLDALEAMKDHDEGSELYQIKAERMLGKQGVE